MAPVALWTRSECPAGSPRSDHMEFLPVVVRCLEIRSMEAWFGLGLWVEIQIVWWGVRSLRAGTYVPAEDPDL